MRLICGVLCLNGANAKEELLRRMAAQMSVPRFQSSLQLWRAGPVGLAVLDFSAHGAIGCPLTETSASVIAADVRLDDPATLRRIVGGDAQAGEDSLLLAMLERFGTRGLAQVLGD